MGGTGPSEGWSPPRKVSVAGQGGTRPEIFQDLPKALKTDFSRFAGSQSPQREGSCQRQGPRRLCAHLPTACPPSEACRVYAAGITSCPDRSWLSRQPPRGSALQAPLGASLSLQPPQPTVRLLTETHGRNSRMRTLACEKNSSEGRKKREMLSHTSCR